MRTRRLLPIAAVAISFLAPTGTAAADEGGLDRARAATARYHQLNAAVADGFQLLTDTAGNACIDNPGVGGMGIHYVKGARVGDPAEHAGAPEVLVYEPQENGRMRLVAVEYVVLQSAWKDAGHSAPPSLFGQRFQLVPAGNRYGLPPFYELHAWIWKHNPSGLFDDWNPRVSCAADRGGLDRARAATARYHQLNAAVADGFQLLTDTAGNACIDNPGVGGMGIHYVKGTRVGDPAERAGAPEVLVYEPQENGRLRLVAVEYVVLQSAWKDAGHSAPPSLFGQRFQLVPAGDRYGLPPFYELHAWIWKHNPSGLFDDWNPRVSCAAA